MNILDHVWPFSTIRRLQASVNTLEAFARASAAREQEIFHELCDARGKLKLIAAQATEHGNATVKRMAAIALGQK